MIVQRVELYPDLGKVEECAKVIEEWAAACRREIPVTLGRRVFGQDGAAVLWISTYGSFQEFDGKYARVLEITRSGRFRARAEALSRRSLRHDLFEVLVLPVERGKTPRLSHRAVVMPRSESVTQVRELLTAFAKDQQRAGRQVFRLSSLLFPPDGPLLALGDGYENLSEFEGVRKKRAKAGEALMEKLGPLTLAPMRHDLYRMDPAV